MPGGGYSVPIPALTGSSAYMAYETFGVGWFQNYVLTAPYIANGMTGTDPPYCRKIARIRDSVGTLLLVEQPLYNGSNVVGGTNAYVSIAWKQLEYNQQPETAEGAAVHGGLRFRTEVAPRAYANFNYLYCDGHVDFTDGLSTVGTGTLSLPKGAWTSEPGD